MYAERLLLGTVKAPQLAGVRRVATACPLWVAGSTGRRNTSVKSPPMQGCLAIKGR